MGHPPRALPRLPRQAAAAAQGRGLAFLRRREFPAGSVALYAAAAALGTMSIGQLNAVTASDSAMRSHYLAASFLPRKGRRNSWSIARSIP